MATLQIRAELLRQLTQLAEDQQCSIDDVLESLLVASKPPGQPPFPLSHETNLKSALDAVPVAITLTRPSDGELLYANALASALIRDQRAGSASGQPVLENLINARDRQMLVEKLHETGAVISIEVPVTNPDGSEGWRLISSTQIDFGGQIAILSAFVDVTGHKHIEQALLESEMRYSGIVRSAMDAIMSISEDERIIVFNRASEIMFGCSAEDALGSPLSRFIPERYRRNHSEHIRRFSETGVSTRSIHSQNELRALRASGEEFPIEATISHYTIGQRKLYTVIVRDISERKKAQALILENERIRIALEKEKEVLALKGRFISTVSHEFRTPLAMIISSSEMLERYSDRLTDERKEECLRTVREQAHEMVSLMNDVLIFNRASAGKVQFKPDYIEINALLYSVIEHIRPVYDPSIHHVVIDNQGQIDTLWADEELLKRVFINLLNNAIKYSPAGGEVRLTVLRQNNDVLFRVSDQGIGIPADDQKHLFEPFHRATNTRGIGGTGLGLMIVKEFIEAHQGSVSVESSEGQGTTFDILLPLPPN